jgi:endonuclease YncB( thermonuclease family)
MSGWGGVLAAAFVAEFAAVCGAFSATAQERPQTAFPCGGETIARGSASRFIDGRTFVLDDGREVRLAAIEVPQLPLPQESGAAPGGAAARDALVSVFAGAEVVLRQAESQKTDRYGRVVAYAFAAHDGVERSAQAELIAVGAARVGARVANRTCAAELLSRESAARRAKLGLWASPYYDLLNAKPHRGAGRTGPFCAGRGQGGFGTRKRRHHLREFRPAVDRGFHRYDPEAK